jgi:hypothetical protein
MKIKSNPRLTLLTIVFGMLVLNYFIENKGVFYSCLVISGIGVFSLKFSQIIENIWFKLSFLLSKIIPNILLTIIFFLILTPLAILSKIFNAKSDFNLNNNQDTFFVKKNRSFDKKSFEKAW